MLSLVHTYTSACNHLSNEGYQNSFHTHDTKYFVNKWFLGIPSTPEIYTTQAFFHVNDYLHMTTYFHTLYISSFSFPTWWINEWMIEDDFKLSLHVCMQVHVYVHNNNWWCIHTLNTEIIKPQTSLKIYMLLTTYMYLHAL